MSVTAERLRALKRQAGGDIRFPRLPGDDAIPVGASVAIRDFVRPHPSPAPASTRSTKLGRGARCPKGG